MYILLMPFKYGNEQMDKLTYVIGKMNIGERVNEDFNMVEIKNLNQEIFEAIREIMPEAALFTIDDPDNIHQLKDQSWGVSNCILSRKNIEV